DIFSLGSVITFAAVGECPFGSGPATVLLYRVVHGEPAIDGVPAQIRSLIARSLSKQAAKRPTAEEFLAQMSATAGPDSLRVMGHAERQPTVAAVVGQGPGPMTLTHEEGDAAGAGQQARVNAQASLAAQPAAPAAQPTPPTGQSAPPTPP